MKPMISKKGSQQVVVLGGNGCVTISATDRKKHVSNSVTVFDELLPGLIARLSAIAATRRRTLRALDGLERVALHCTCPDDADHPDCPVHGASRQ